jgi:hypothetical protein
METGKGSTIVSVEIPHCNNNSARIRVDCGPRKETKNVLKGTGKLVHVRWVTEDMDPHRVSSFRAYHRAWTKATIVGSQARALENDWVSRVFPRRRAIMCADMMVKGTTDRRGGGLILKELNL